MKTSRIVLVTGASSGFGRAIAVALAKAGHRVFGTTRRPQGDAPPGVAMQTLDVRSDDSVQACIDAVVRSADRLDVLVNNAGYVLAGAIEETSIAEAKGQFDTNFFGVIRMVNAALPLMRAQRGGRIINIGSLVGLLGAPFSAIYSASKFALEGYSEALRHEVKAFNIHVSLLEPGFFRTNIGEASLPCARDLDAYRPARQRVARMVARSVAAGGDPNHLAELVLRIVNEASPRLRYRVGRDAVWLPRIRRMLPAAVFEAMARKRFEIDAPR